MASEQNGSLGIWKFRAPALCDYTIVTIVGTKLQRRRRLEGDVTAMTNDLGSLRANLDEESELRLDLERKLSNEVATSAQYKGKYEMECRAHFEDVEEIKYVKYANVFPGFHYEL